MPGSLRFGSRRGIALSLFLIGLVGLAPLVLGSNNPATWMVETLLIAGVAVAYLLVSPDAFEGRHIALGSLGWLALPLLAYCALQLVPIGIPPLVAGLQGTGAISIATGDTWLGLLDFFGFAVFALLVRSAGRHEERRRLLLLAAFVVVVLYALLGLTLLRAGDTLLFAEKRDYRGLATATFVNRNSYATFLAMGFGVGLAWTVGQVRSGHAKLLADRLGVVASVLGLAIIAGALLATNSRMGLIACLVGALTVAFLWIATSRVTATRVIVVGLTGLVGASLLFVTLGTELVGRAINAQGDFAGRLELYRQVAGMIVARPLTGLGLHSFEVAFPLFHQLPLATESTIVNAHSTYLALWVELGLVFGSLPILMVALVFFRAVRTAFQPEGDWFAGASVAGVIAAAATHSTIDFSLEIQANALYLIFIAMLLPPRVRNGQAAGKAEASPAVTGPRRTGSRRPSAS